MNGFFNFEAEIVLWRIVAIFGEKLRENVSFEKLKKVFFQHELPTFVKFKK
jgi:hypothetical protein